MKKIFSLILSGLLIASAVITASAASVSDFSDMPDDWSTPALTAAVENGLLTGSDGKILPKDNLTRAQMATIIVRAFGAQSTASLDGFTDVPADSWYYEYMQKAVAMGVFTGDGSGLLTPDNNITREQVFAVLSRAFKLSDGDASVLDKFTDKGDISSWATGYAAALVGNGYVNGSDGKLNPQNYITRAEFAQIMYNMIKTYIDNPQTLTGEYSGSVIIRASDVTVSKTAKISGNLVICEGCTNITIEDKTRIGNIIDNRKDTEDDSESSETGSETTTTPEKEEEKDKDDDFFLVIDPPSSGNSDDDINSDVEIGSDDDNEGWSDIYRP